MKRRVKKVYKKLPPHTYEAHPVASAGEASKPLIIGIITIVAVVALSLLLLFSEQLVGKAFFFAEEPYSAGAKLVPEPVYENEKFSLKVQANTVNTETNTVSFVLQLPGDMSCSNVLNIQSLGWELELEKKCILVGVEDQIFFTYATLGAGKKGIVDVAQIDFTALPIADFYKFYFKSFQALDKDGNNIIPKDKVLNPEVEVKKLPSCSDFDIGPGEQCDDGNVNSGDGCSASCQKEICGDGAMQAGLGEQCDDSNTVTESCKYGEKSCNICDSQCKLVAGQASYCGDNKYDKDNGETCDGSDLRGETCVSQGFISGTLSCSADCKSFNNVACTKQVQQVQAVCGNGIKEDPEQCDDKNIVNGDGCSSTCMTEQMQPLATCSDNLKNGQETSVDCGGVACSKCEVENACVSNSDCKSDYCNNKICYPALVCSGTLPSNANKCPGSDTSLDKDYAWALTTECGTAKCKYVVCNEGFTFDSNTKTCIQKQPLAPTCSDKIKNGKETDIDCGGADCAKCIAAKACTTNTDCASNVCTNLACQQAQVPLPPPTPAVCGDGKVEDLEQCDDKNVVNNDGCSSTCMTESGFTCTGQPSVCQKEQVVPLASAAGKKITLTDVAQANNIFSTKITATESFANEVTVYTVLYGLNDKVLSIKSEKVEKGLAKDETYTATVNYPDTNVKKKSVIVYDVKQNPSVFGQLQVQKQ